MGKNQHPCLAQTTTINDAGMVQFIAENEILPAYQSGDNSPIRCVAAVVKQGSLCALESGQAVSLRLHARRDYRK